MIYNGFLIARFVFLSRQAAENSGKVVQSETVCNKQEVAEEEDHITLEILNKLDYALTLILVKLNEV